VSARPFNDVVDIVSAFVERAVASSLPKRAIVVKRYFAWFVGAFEMLSCGYIFFLCGGEASFGGYEVHINNKRLKVLYVKTIKFLFEEKTEENFVIISN
tara:strand:- start:94 stop:390 length:297 start_codon:yes stop_codon:yes gene_type:complete